MQDTNTKSRDFNIYYLNFSKVYEIAMMINNVILTKIERDNTHDGSHRSTVKTGDTKYHFVDTLAIIQDVTFNLGKPSTPKLHWWNRVGIWLSKLWRN